MSKRISRATKLARGQGSGEGAKYKSYVMTNEFNSLGTTSVIKDWKQDVAFIVCHRRKLYGFTFSAGTIII